MVGQDEPDNKLAREGRIEELSTIVNDSQPLSSPTNIYRLDLYEALLLTTSTKYRRPADTDEVLSWNTKFTCSRVHVRDIAILFLPYSRQETSHPSVITLSFTSPVPVF